MGLCNIDRTLLNVLCLWPSQGRGDLNKGQVINHGKCAVEAQVALKHEDSLTAGGFQHVSQANIFCEPSALPTMMFKSF